MANQAQRDELHKQIWSMAEKLRGSVDSWEFRNYVLGFLFYRYISENFCKYINEDVQKKKKDFDYANFSDEEAERGREGLIKEKGFFIKPSELFCNVTKNAANDYEDLNTKLEKIFKNIENSAIGKDSEYNFKGLFSSINLRSENLGNSLLQKNKKLAEILQDIQNIKLKEFVDNEIDVFGDAYEFLIGMYSSKAGKSGGEFFTPQEVSELLVKITLIDFENIGSKKNKTKIKNVYDPACGSGSLLLKFAKILGKNQRITYYGQEKNPTTYNLARINMFLHNIPFEHFNIRCEDTLINPQHNNERPFDAIVSNPPYSIEWEGKKDINLINDPRFTPAGVLAPDSKADLAFVMHSLHYLKPNATAAIVSFPGIMYRGGVERKIRKYLIENNHIDTIIQLPDNLFYGVTIPTCILVLRKKTKNEPSAVYFIDASNEYIKNGIKNHLEPEHINKIIDAIKTKKDIDHFAKSIPLKEIIENDVNLSVSKYVLKKEEVEIIDIKVLNENLKNTVSKQEQIRKELNEIIDQLEHSK